jgi:2'-hydroxyisoflavone reductase
MSSRREFIKLSAAVAAAMGLSSNPLMAQLIKPASKPLNILFLGGTGFLGPHTVNYALARGHKVTLFNRGRSKEGLFDELETIIGNRDPQIDAGLSGLKGRKWDCVIDTSGYVPRIVSASAKLLAEHCEQYLFISSISVYANYGKKGLDESGEVGTLEDPTVEQITNKTYGPLKAYSEQAAEVHFKDRTTVIRPGLIVGPRDRSDRYTYWPVNIDRGGEVLAPGDGKDIVQYIDVRDLGAFIVTCLENKAYGTFNATSPATETTEQMLAACQAVTDSDAKLTWVDAEFLTKQAVSAWGDIPVWVPKGHALEGFAHIDVSKAVAAGLTFRERTKTAKDTLNWFKSAADNGKRDLKYGISKEREQQVLKAWHDLKQK